MIPGLTANTSPDSSTGFAPFGTSGLIWAYDSFGNMQSETLASGSSMSLPSPAASSYDANNRVMGYSYDASGNLKSDLLRGSSSYQYDAENRISVAFGSTAYVYDAEGNRVAKESVANGQATLTNQYILGLGGEQVTEIDGNGIWLHSNAYAAGKLLATYDTTGLHFHFSDWLGSRRMQASGTGPVDETCQSLPFGDMLNCTGPASDATEQHFTGKVRDNESGLDYFSARYYQSNAGRWMSPDWAKTPEGVPYAVLGNPQSLNLYGYVLNNPLSKTDPDGHGVWDLAKKWLNTVEVTVGASVGVGASGQWGTSKGEAHATLIGVQAKSGLAGGGADAKVTSGVGASGSAGPAKAGVSAGGQVSVKDGASASAGAHASIGPAQASATASINSEGGHTSASATIEGPEAHDDSKVGASATVGVTFGLAINLTAVSAAWSSTMDAAQSVENYLMTPVMVNGQAAPYSGSLAPPHP
jgi:RHS repeat-associated protein